MVADIGELQQTQTPELWHVQRPEVCVMHGALSPSLRNTAALQGEGWDSSSPPHGGGSVGAVLSLVQFDLL